MRAATAGLVGRLAVGAMVLAALVSCGDGTDPTAGPSPFRGIQPAGTYEAEAKAVARPERGTLRLATRDVAAGCSKKPRATVVVEIDPAEARDFVYVNLTQDVVAPSGKATCLEQGVRHVVVDLGVRGSKASQVVVNNQAWGAKDQLGELQKCEAPFGCAGPPTDHCDQAWIDQLLSGVEIAPERQTETVACDGTWLILDVDAVVSGCESRDGAAPPSGCAGKGTHARWFARFSEKDPVGWDVVASGDEAGCAVPAAKHLDIPRALCRDLPGREK